MKFHEIVESEARIWARPVWGPLGPRDRVSAYGKEAVARKLEREAKKDADLILTIGVGTEKRNLPKHLTGCLLNVTTIVPRLMRTEDIIGHQFYRERYIVEGKERWPWGLPIVRAWSILNHPHADDILPNLRRDRFTYHHEEMMVTRLSPAEIDRVSQLEIVPLHFEVQIADESGLAAQRLASQRERRWAGKLASVIAGRCQKTPKGYFILRPGVETSETDLNLIMTRLLQSQAQRCALCGGALDLSDNPNPLAAPSADRIDSNLRVYDRENLQITHLACNLGKRSAENEVAREFFRAWCGQGHPDDETP